MLAPTPWVARHWVIDDIDVKRIWRNEQKFMKIKYIHTICEVLTTNGLCLFTIHDVERDDHPKSDVGETVSPLYDQTNLRVSGRPVSLGVAGQILPEGKVDTAMNDALIQRLQNRSFTRNQTLLPSLNSKD